MKKIISVILTAVVIICVLSACGKTFVCHDCGKKTSKAYYDMKADINYVMCEECAQQYWMPLDYKTYRVK